MSRRIAWSALLLLIGIALGGLREFLFVNLNYQLDHLQRGTPYSYAHSAFQQWSAGCTATELAAIKWGLSAGFVLVNLTLTMVMGRVRFGARWPWRMAAALFLAVAGMAGALFALSKAHPWLYPAAVQLAHAVQYPLPMALLWLLSLAKPADGSDRYI
jgi:hypothetical protein